jgi:hypothetical protein
MDFHKHMRHSRQERCCCRDKGWRWGWAGALCLSSWPQEASGSGGAHGSPGTQDRRHLPPHPLHPSPCPYRTMCTVDLPRPIRDFHTHMRHSRQERCCCRDKGRRWGWAYKCRFFGRGRMGRATRCKSPAGHTVPQTATIKAHPAAPLRPIDSNKIEQAHHLPSFLGLGLGLGPGPARTFALGVANSLAWAQGLRRCRRDPGRIHKGHLNLEARAGPNETYLASESSQIGQRSDAPREQTGDDLHRAVRWRRRRARRPPGQPVARGRP